VRRLDELGVPHAGSGAVRRPVGGIGCGFVSTRARFVRGLSWKAVSQSTLVGARVVVLLAYARLLDPSEYGLAAMAIAVVAIGSALADLSLAPALVQRRELTPADRSTALWTAVAVGAAFGVILVALAGPISSYYGEPDVQPLVAVLAVGFVLNAPAVVQSALLQRRFAFRASEVAVAAGAVAGAAAGIAVAASGGGAWAVVAQQLTTMGVTTFALWAAAPWLPAATVAWGSLRRLAPFSLRLYASRLLFSLSRTLDDVLVGRFLGPTQLGLYGLAYNLVISPFARIADPVRAVLFPLLAEAQADRARVGALWLRTSTALSAFFLPALAGLAVVAPDLVEVVLGEQWMESVTVIRILAGAALLQVFVALTTVVLAALDDTRTILRLAAFTAVASVAGFAAGLPFGIEGVAAGYLAANVVVVPYGVRATALAVDRRGSELAWAVRGVAEATAVMALATVTLRASMEAAGAGALARLAVVTAAGIATYLLAARYRAPDLADEVRRLRRDLRAPKARVQ
jgi:O-antigen/teichoic acid export membrane protein